MLPRSTLARDLSAAAIITVVAQVELVLVAPENQPWHHLVTLVIIPAFGLRRTAPTSSVLVASAGLLTNPIVGPSTTAVPYLTLLVLLASLGWHGTLHRGAAAIAAALVCGLGPGLGSTPVADITVNATLIIVPWVGGRALRATTDRRVAAEVDAEQRGHAAVERERTRIAQDLHDSLAHALTLITLNAAGARERATENVSASALRAIEMTGREALADMHRFLGLLGPSDGEVPGIRDLEELVDGVRGRGLDVRLTVNVQADVPASVSTAAYRVVQEGLTNIVRHSGASTARVQVCERDGSLTAEVVDDGRGTAPRTSGSGCGLTGLRRRLDLFGGELDAGRTDDGWRLVARIPLRTAT